MIQGNFDNNYFLSAVAAVAERDDLLKRIFLVSYLQPEGILPMTVFINGLPQTLLIDDSLSFKLSKTENSQNYYTFAFSSATKDYALWLPLLEKAWAKFNGNYRHT
jgi:hypothetical protein